MVAWLCTFPSAALSVVSTALKDIVQCVDQYQLGRHCDAGIVQPTATVVSVFVLLISYQQRLLSRTTQFRFFVIGRTTRNRNVWKLNVENAAGSRTDTVQSKVISV